MMRTRRRGFTLVEVLIAIALAAVFGVLAVRAFESSAEGARERETGVLLAHIAGLALQQAIRTPDATTRLVLNGTQAFVDTNGVAIPMSVRTLPAGASAAATAIVARADGRFATATVVAMTFASSAYSVVIEPSGDVHGQ